jgi:hypothetical protein
MMNADHLTERYGIVVAATAAGLGNPGSTR